MNPTQCLHRPHHLRGLRPTALLAAVLASLTLPAAHAQTTPAATPAATPATNTVDLIATHSSISAGLPDGQALNLRLTSLRGGDDVLRAELLSERRFGATGGVIGAGFSHGLSADWFMGANLTLGHGGPNWPRQRLDLSLSTRLGAQRDTIAQVSAYRALYDNQRSDRGLGLALISYAFSPLVLQAGVTANVSDPGAVNSAMTTLSGTWGQEGQQYISLRLSSAELAPLARPTLGFERPGRALPQPELRAPERQRRRVLAMVSCP